MDPKIKAHLADLTRSAMTARATRMPDIIEELEDLAEDLDEDDCAILDRAIQEITDLRIEVQHLRGRA